MNDNMDIVERFRTENKRLQADVSAWRISCNAADQTIKVLRAEAKVMDKQIRRLTEQAMRRQKAEDAG